MDESALVITCTRTEAAFLASLLGADLLIGLDDPFRGWLADEIEAAWEEAKSALAQRQFIRIEEDGGIVMDTTVAALIGVWAFADASFLLRLTTWPHAEHTVAFHVVPPLSVEVHVEEEQCHLTPLEDAMAVYQRIVTLCQIETPSSLPDIRLYIEENVLSEALTRAQEEETTKVAQFLQQHSSISAQGAEVLADTLSHLVRSGMLVGMARRSTTWEVDSTGFLVGQNGLWCLRSINHKGTPRFECRTCTPEGFYERVRRVMDRLLPEPLPAE